MRLSVIVPVGRFDEFVAEQLTALAGQDHDEPWELFLVGRPVEALEAAVAELDFGTACVAVLDDRGAQRPATKRNTGAEAATGRYLAFCDSDDVVHPRWVRTYSDEANDGVVLHGKIDSLKLNSEEVLRWRVAAFAADASNREEFMPYGPTANLCVPRDAFAAIGGFRDDIPGSEDKDLCWRLQLAGLSIRRVRKAIVYYRHRPTVRGAMRQHYVYGYFGPFLYKEYRGLGMPSLPPRRALAAWLSTLGRSWTLLQSAERPVYLCQLAYRTGRVVGSIKARVVFL